MSVLEYSCHLTACLSDKTAFKLIVTHEANLHYGRLSLKGFLPPSLWGNIKEVKAQGV